MCRVHFLLQYVLEQMRYYTQAKQTLYNYVHKN